MRVLRRASSAYLLRHPWQLLTALAGICIGVGVMVAVDLANESARRAFLMSVEAINGEATHQIVAGPGGVDESLYVELRAERGFRKLAPVVEDWVEAGGRSLHLMGVDLFAERSFRAWSLAGAAERDVVAGDGGADGREATRLLLTVPDAVVLAARTAEALGLETGDSFALTVRGRQVEARLVAVAGTAADPRLDDLVVADLATAQEWLGRVGRLSRIDVRAEDERALERLAEALPAGVQLLPAAQRTQAVGDMSDAFMTNLTAMSLLALLVGVFLIYNSVSFAVLQRRHLIGILRALGLTRSQTLGLILGESLVLGAVGALLGLGLGVWLGGELLGLVSRSINDLYFVVNVTEVTVSGDSIARGVLAGIGATLLAAAVPAAEAASFTPRLALARSALEERAGRLLSLAALGGFLLAALALLLIEVSGRSLVASLAALFLLIFGLALCIPVLVRAAAWMAAPIAALVGGTPARLAVAGVGASLSRTGVAVVALGIAISATVGVGTMVDSFRASVAEWLGGTLRADLYVAAADGELDPGLVGEIESLPGVAVASSSRRAWLHADAGLTRLTAIRMAPESYAGFSFRQADPQRVWPAFEERGALLVSESYAWRHGVTPGDTLALPTDRGERVFPVAAVYRSYDSDLDAVVMSRATYDVFWDDRAVDSLGIYLEQGAEANAVMQTIAAAVGGRQPLQIRSNREIREQSMEVFDRTFVITDVLYWLALIVAVIGILGAMLALQLERAREIGVLRALGMTPAQVRAMVTVQTGFMGLMSGLAAIPLGLVMAVALVEVINRRAFGWQIDLVVSSGSLAAAAALGVAVAVLAGLYPAWRAARLSPARVLSEE